MATNRDDVRETWWGTRPDGSSIAVDIVYVGMWCGQPSYHYRPTYDSNGHCGEVKTIGPMVLDNMRAFVHRHAAPEGTAWAQGCTNCGGECCPHGYCYNPGCMAYSEAHGGGVTCKVKT